MNSVTINLAKGQRIDLAKVAPNVSVFAFALGWNPQTFDGAAFDLDASAFLTKGGKCSGAEDLVGYMTTGFVTEEDIQRNPSLKGGIQDYLGFASHSGDDKTGGAAGDDETLTINTTKIDTNKYDEIQFNATIYDAANRKQTFGQVDDAFIRVYDPATGKEICRFDLTEDYCTHTAVVVGKLYFKDGSWRFQAVGGGFDGGLSALVNNVGLNANNG